MQLLREERVTRSVHAPVVPSAGLYVIVTEHVSSYTGRKATSRHVKRRVVPKRLRLPKG